MQKYKLVIAYDGTDYCGWQWQPQVPTITGVLQDKFFQVFNKDIRIVGASRTDGGVHALGQVAHFHTDLVISIEKLKMAWNNLLPCSILIRDIKIVSPDFHPQAKVLEKTYFYHFFINRPVPFYSRYGLFYKLPINLDKLKQCLNLFIGTHDFRSFCTGYDQQSTIRTVNSIELSYIKKYSVYRITVKGPAFLRYMIRRIVGASLEVSSHDDKDISLISKALEEKNPHQNLPTAPAKGLLLYKIKYQTLY